MGMKKIMVSDISGDEVPEGDSAQVRISFPNSDEVRVLDITRKEAEEYFSTWRTVKKRGRTKASENGGEETNGDDNGEEKPEETPAPEEAPAPEAPKAGGRRR